MEKDVLINEIDSFAYPKQLFLAEENGGYQFYKEDPMTCTDRVAARINLGELLVGWVGHCDVGNPIVLKVQAGRLDRCRSFQATAPEKIRRGTLIAHFEDFDGNYVKIHHKGTGIFEFPFFGAVVRKKDRAFLGYRYYSARGDCADLNPDHRIVMLLSAIELDVPDPE